MPKGKWTHPLGGRILIRRWIIDNFEIGEVVTMEMAENFVAQYGYARSSANALVTGLKIAGYVKRYQRRTFQVISHDPTN